MYCKCVIRLWDTSPISNLGSLLASPSEEELAEDKQKMADDCFQSLLQQAQDKKRRKREHSPDPALTTMPGMLPSGFGRANRPDVPLEAAAEDKEVHAKQKMADDYFQSLLQQAQDKKRRKRARSPDPALTTMPGMPPIGFGRANRPDVPLEAAAVPVKKDPGIAIWEKHEKGIGSKLLFKMGWKGSGGLGSNRRKFQSKSSEEGKQEPAATAISSSSSKSGTPSAKTDETESNAKKGISRPVEVVVRPANLGLGFGNFKEMSKLKTNLQIEAEVRGIQLPKKKTGVLDILEERDDDDENEDDDLVAGGKSTASSAIPSTQELMTQKAWKRRKAKRVAPKIIPYQELVAWHEQKSNNAGQPVIIDMRGPSTAAAGTGAAKDDGKVPLGEELLHNVTFMLNTHENQLHSYSQLVKSTERKEASLQSEVADLQRQQQETRERREKLERALAVVQKVEDLAQNPLDGNQPIEQVIQWIEELGDSFSTVDRTSLKFWQTLAPALLSPILQVKLEQWDPLGPMEQTKELLDSLFHIQTKGSSEHDKEALQELRYSILHGQLLPRIHEVLESTRWDPTVQMDVVVDMYEFLQSLVAKVTKAEKEAVTYPEDQVFSAGSPDKDHTDAKHGGDLGETFRKALVLDTIYPKLQTTLSHWKPSLSSAGRHRLDKRLDLWILPWMPHLDHPAILSNLLLECKLKLKSSLPYLQRKIGKEDDLEFVIAATDTLKPWARVFDRKILQNLVSEYVTPYMARALAKVKVHRKAREQNWTIVHRTIDLHSLGLLSDIEFCSVLEAELLPRWASKMNDMLLDKSINAEEAAAIYLNWKRELLVNTPSSPAIHSMKLLQRDSRVCAIFYTVLRMIQLAGQSDSSNELEFLYPTTTNYHVVSVRRIKEQQSQAEDEFVRMESRSTPEIEARLRLRRRQVDTPSFREVVEEFARERGILFQPRMGAKALKDGKQVFLFGEKPIYIEGDVVYNLQGGNWRPISLDQLMDASAS